MSEVLVFEDTTFVFETVMRVRNTEIDSGQYLTIGALTELLSETIARFLYSKGIKQIDADYQGLIVDRLELNIEGLVRAREALLFEVGVAAVSNKGCDINIKVTRMHDDSLVAKSRQHLVNYDYRSNLITSLSKLTKQALEQLLKSSV